MTQQAGKKTKLEKIHELESKLAFEREDNRRLRKELKAVRGTSAEPCREQSTRSSRSTENTSAEDEVKRLQAIVDTLQQVTVDQQASLKSLRAKSHHRKEEIQQKDATIHELSSKLKCFQQMMDTGGLDGPGSEESLRFQVLELQQALDDKEDETTALRKQLEESQLSLKKLAAPATPVKLPIESTWFDEDAFETDDDEFFQTPLNFSSNKRETTQESCCGSTSTTATAHSDSSSSDVPTPMRRRFQDAANKVKDFQLRKQLMEANCRAARLEKKLETASGLGNSRSLHQSSQTRPQLNASKSLGSASATQRQVSPRRLSRTPSRRHLMRAQSCRLITPAA